MPLERFNIEIYLKLPKLLIFYFFVKLLLNNLLYLRIKRSSRKITILCVIKLVKNTIQI